MSVKTLYNPAALSKDELVANFVVRTTVFEKIFKDIKSSDMKYPEKHYLIQGQRGMGKTTLLLRLKYEVENTLELNSWLIPVFFGEETYDVNTLAGLWEKLLRYLDDHFDTNGAYYQYTEDFLEQEDYEKRCFEYLVDCLRDRGVKLLILFDNFGELFLDHLREKEKRRFREILISCSDIRIIGASAIVMNDLHDYSQPFFEFFQIIRLDGLSKDETYDLIARLQDDCREDKRINLKKNKPKIETLTVLTGGVIRTIMMLYQVLLDDEDGSALQDLEKVLDKATPLYKHRIEDLPIQQRRIVDVIAKKWDAVSAKEIAEEIREDGKKVSSKLISAQLNQLEKNNVIEKKNTSTKNNLYQLKERFFNIWYLMRNGDRRDRRRVEWLTKFLELWYEDEDGFQLFLQNHLRLLSTGKYHAGAALLMAEALTNSDKLNDIEGLEELLKRTSEVLPPDQKNNLPDIDHKKYAIANRKIEQGNLSEALDALESIKKKTLQQYALLVWGYLRNNQKPRAYEVASSAIEKEDYELLALSRIFCSMRFNEMSLFFLDHIKDKNNLDAVLVRGEIKLSEGSLKEAKTFFKHVLSKDSSRVDAKIGVAKVYIEEKMFDKAEQLLLDDIEHDNAVTTLMDAYFMQMGAVDPSVFIAKMEYVFGHITDKRLKGNASFLVFKSLFLFYQEVHRTDEASVSEDKVWETMVSYLWQAKELFDAEFYSGHLYTVMCSQMYFLFNKFLFDKTQARKLNDELKKDGVGVPLVSLYMAFVDVWDGKYNVEYLSDKKFTKNISAVEGEVFNDILLLLLAKRQYHTVLYLFKENVQLKEVFKPTYYALMTFLKKEYPNEVLKMGEELEEPVKEILERIEEMKEEYK